MDIQYANGTQHEITIYNIDDCVSVQGGRCSRKEQFLFKLYLLEET